MKYTTSFKHRTYSRRIIGSYNHFLGDKFQSHIKRLNNITYTYKIYYGNEKLIVYLPYNYKHF